eukprot:PhM_4_TR13352/c0_g1_i1/m.92058
MPHHHLAGEYAALRSYLHASSARFEAFRSSVEEDHIFARTVLRPSDNYAVYKTNVRGALSRQRRTLKHIGLGDQVDVWTKLIPFLTYDAVTKLSFVSHPLLVLMREAMRSVVQVERKLTVVIEHRRSSVGIPMLAPPIPLEENPTINRNNSNGSCVTSSPSPKGKGRRVSCVSIVVSEGDESIHSGDELSTPINRGRKGTMMVAPSVLRRACYCEADLKKMSDDEVTVRVTNCLSTHMDAERQEVFLDSFRGRERTLAILLLDKYEEL